MWPQRFLGIKTTVPKSLPNNTFVIMWKSNPGSDIGHWYGIYNKNGKMGEVDSYENDNVPSIPDYNFPNHLRQGYDGIDRSDCGQRLVKWMTKIFPL